MNKPTTDGRTSLGNYSNSGSFGNAFKNAHANGGSGHTFSYNDKIYTTNRADGKDCRTVPDNREDANHGFRSFGHSVNSAVKDATNGKASFDFLTGRSYNWSSEVDKQRVKYHDAEIKKGKK